MHDELIGRKLGQYEIRMLLGKGGMSTVYLGYQPSMERTVAIKVLPREFLHDATFLARFQQEVRTIAGLEHLHILPVYDVGEDGGLPYLVMRYLSGGTLGDLMGGKLLELPVVARVAVQVADALDYAHSKGIIHRDLKPSNVLLDGNGNAYLADFGIARVQEASVGLTGSRVIGTPPYVAPEAVRKGEMITHSVDIYALGVIVYQMLTGEPPFYDPDPMKTLMAHVLEPVPSVCDFDPNFSPAIDAVVRRSLAKSPQERYATAGDFARELALAISGARPTLHMQPVQDAPPAPAPVPVMPPATDTQPGRTQGHTSVTPPEMAFEAALPDADEDFEDAYDEPPRRRLGCWVGVGVVLSLLAGAVLTAIAVTGGKPLSLLNISLQPTRTITPTVTPTVNPNVTPEPTRVVSTVLPPPGGGGRLAFASTRDGDYEIFVVDADGANVRQLTNNSALDYAPTWSPDGTQIAYTSTSDGDAEIKIMNADGSDIRQITNNACKDADPAWSPDGQWIAYESNCTGSFNIVIIHPDGTGMRQVTGDDLNDQNPTWSPDGRHIGYYAKVGDNNDTTDLYIVDVQTGEQTRLTNNAVLDQWPNWSHDGTRLAFTSSQGLPEGQRAVFQYDLETGTVTQLTNGTAHDDDPAWSPDDSHLAFDSDRDGDGFFDLYVLDIRTGAVEQLTYETANDVAPAWQPQR